MSKAELNFCLKQFYTSARQKDGSYYKKHGGNLKLILDNHLSTRDYGAFYPVLVHIS